MGEPAFGCLYAYHEHSATGSPPILEQAAQVLPEWYPLNVSSYDSLGLSVMGYRKSIGR